MGNKPPERLEIEMRPGRSPGEFSAQIVVAVVLAVAALALVTAWQPFVGPIMIGVALLFVILMIRSRARRRVGWRLIADTDEIRLESTTSAPEEARRLTLDAHSVQRVDTDDQPNHHTLWAKTRDGERVVLFEDLTDAEAEASTKALRETIPPAR